MFHSFLAIDFFICTVLVSTSMHKHEHKHKKICGDNNITGNIMRKNYMEAY